MPFSDFEDIFNNIKKITKKKNQKEVAEDLGITASAITDAKGRNVVPDRWFDIIKDKYGITKEELRETPEEKLVRTYGKNPVTSSVGIPWQSEPAAKPTPAIEKDLTEAIDMPEMVKMTMEVLASDTDHRSALASHIRASHKAVNMEKEMNEVRQEIAAMAERMARMEEMLLSIGATLPEKRDKKAM